jgi:hypothetical protein
MLRLKLVKSANNEKAIATASTKDMDEDKDEDKDRDVLLTPMLGRGRGYCWS